MKPGDRLICIFVKPLASGQTFKSWPLHLTVVPWFRVELASGELADILSAKLADVPDFLVKVEGRGGFGHRHKEAAQVNRPDELTELEKAVRGTLKDQNAWVVDESTRLKREFSPHVTDQKPSVWKPAMNFGCRDCT